MGVSGAGGGYIGQEIVRTQGATSLRVGSSGEIVFEPGGEQAGLVGDILWDLSAGVVASASGAAFLIASGANPGYARMNGSTNPQNRIRWTSNAGTTTPVTFPNMAIPDDLDKAYPLLFRLYGEGSSAQAITEVTLHVHINGGADVGSTCRFTSAPAESVVSVASGSLASSPGTITPVIHPTAHASGSIDIYSLKATYKRRSRST